jgi:hypothetical protein
MFPALQNARYLGLICLAVGSVDTLLRLTHIATMGQPLGTFAICGLLLLMRSASRRLGALLAIVNAGIAIAWSAICLVVVAFVRPLGFPPPLLFVIYLVGSVSLGLWAWIVLKHLSVVGDRPVEAD